VLFGVGGPQNFWDAGPSPLETGIACPLETRYCPTRVIKPNFVGQTVWA